MKDLTRRKSIKLTIKEKKEIKKILKSREVVTRVYKRARVLYLVSSGQPQTKAALQSGFCGSTGKKISARYKRGGLEGALYDRPRSGQPRRFTDKQKQEAIAMICSEPPKGHNRWTVRMIVKELKRRKITEGISRYWYALK